MSSLNSHLIISYLDAFEKMCLNDSLIKNNKSETLMMLIVAPIGNSIELLDVAKNKRDYLSAYDF